MSTFERINNNCLGAMLLSFSVMLCLSCIKMQGETPVDGANLQIETENASCQESVSPVHIEADCSWSIAIENIGDNETSWASLAETSGSGDADVALSYESNGSEEARSLSVVLTCEDGSVVQKGFVQAGVSPDPPVNGERPGWLELPQNDGELTYYNHSFSFEGDRYRNYSFAWDASKRLAHWVAYPLCRFYTGGSARRTNAWSFDPSVPVSEQANLTRSYQGSFDRGHQIPSADRYVCSQANVQTFYFSNMTPQRSTFNQGIWGVIEKTVRGWSDKSDTLYVVTGCVIDGLNGSTTDAAGNDCPLPKAYYKAVLRLSKAGGGDSYCGIGIYLDHNGTYGRSLTRNMVMSLGNLEKKIGYRLFVNLDKLIGSEAVARIKSQDPTTVPFWELGN